MSLEVNESTTPTSLTRSLNFKLLMAVLVMSLVPLIAVAFVGVNRAKSYLATEAGAQMEILAIETGDKVDRTLMERYRDVQAFATNPLVLESASQRADFLDFLMTKYGFYDLMVVTNLEGQIVGVNGVDELGEPIDSTALIGSDVSDTPWFQAISSGEIQQGTSYYSEAQSSPLVEAVYGETRLTLPFSAPIFDRSGQMVAIWHNEASFDRIVAQTMNEVKADLAAHDFTTAQSQVLRSDGLVLHDSSAAANQTTVLTTNLADAGLGAATALVETQGTGFTNEAIDGGEQQIIGYAPADGVANFEGYDWGILMRVDSAEALQRSNSLQTIMLLFGLFAVIAVSAASYYLAQWISQPIQTMSARAVQIANGNMSVEQLTIERDDELGDMATAFNDMLATLSIASSQASAIANKHLSDPVLNDELPGDFGRAIQSMVASIKEMVSKLGDKSKVLAEGAQQLANASQATASEVELTNSKAEDMSHSGDEVSTSVTTVAAAIEELNASIQEVSSNAAVASNTANDAVAVAQSASERIADLGQSSEEVGNVVDVISSIAEQTNLLALNATIEAARAGEAGKGFAVVANEVKELANQTALATEEISNRIQNIQTQTTSAIEANRLIGSTIEQIDEVSTTIAAAVEQQSSATSEIGQSMEDAAAGADEIARSITEVANAASGARGSTAQTKQSAQSIAEVAAELSQLVAEYR